ncbi:PH domain-containing protein [Micromonospora sp. NPDC018662]|uniref:PH domain-containing protein n=1 Tax=Micromonospora sp. NPDC018662 TaxID=3364238 RepID=UPI0037964D42
MRVDPMGRSGRDRVFYGIADRWIGRLLLLFVVVAVPRELSGPSLAGIPFDVAAAAFFAVMGWICFRMGFRTRLAARRDHFEVVNLLAVERIPYREVAAVHLDQLSVRITLTSGERVRAWGLSDSLLNTGGSERQNLVDRLRVIAAERRTEEGPRRTRSRFPDWWAPLALFAIFSGAIVLRLLTR